MSTARPRSPVVPPSVIPEGMTLLEYLNECQPPLAQKIAEIACSQGKVPFGLKDDAIQEIFIMWMTMRPDTNAFKPGQVASYAHRMALHAVLRTRRELEKVVRLPGSAFRKKADGESYVTPGVLAEALNWDDLESWFETDEVQETMVGATPSPEELLLRHESEQEDDPDVLRRATIEANKEALTPRQYQILTRLVDGADYETVMREAAIKKSTLLRELSVATAVLSMGQEA